MGNQCCTPADKDFYDSNGQPIPRNKLKDTEAGLLSGELKLKKTKKFLEAQMDSKIADLEEEARKPTLLRDRRRSTVRKAKKENDPNYLKSYDGDAEQDAFDPLENKQRLALALNQSGYKQKKSGLNNSFSKKLQGSLKNMSVHSNNKSILSAAMAQSSSQAMSSRMSSRLSIQSKRKLIALQSANKREQYTSLYKDVALNKIKIQRDSKWLKDKLQKILESDSNLKQDKICQSVFYLYGGSLLTLPSTCLVHSYLYANLVELVDEDELKDFNYKQVIVREEVNSRLQKSFTPDDLNKIINFVNSHSNIFKFQKQASSKNIEFKNEQGEVVDKNFQIKSIQHLYDSLNAHVFQVIESTGRCDQFSEKTQYILKVPRTQTKKGIFDLIFETQLQQYLYMKKFPYQFQIKEEIFQIQGYEESQKLINYVAIEERQNCGIFNAQLTLRDFLNQYKMSPASGGDNLAMQQKKEKLLYIFLQAIDLAKQLTKDHKLINYNICPLNLVITEHFKLKLVDFSLVDFSSIQHDDQSSIASHSSEQTIQELSSIASQKLQKPIVMRSQFKAEINKLKDALQSLQLNNVAQPTAEEVEQLGLVQGAQLINQQIKTADDYFNLVQKIKSPDYFTLNLITKSFQELFPQTDVVGPGGIVKKQKVGTDHIDNDIARFIAEIITQSDSAKQLDIILNNVESHICFDMQAQDFDDFVKLFSSPEKSSLNQQARLKMAKKIYEISIAQNSEKLQALCLLAIGEITKNIRTLKECLHLYENSQSEDQVLNKIQFSQLCLLLAREYRLLGGNSNQQKGMFYLEQAYNLNQGTTVVGGGDALDQVSAKSHNEIMLQYYQEMSEQYLADKKMTQAIECQKKALQIAKAVHGSDSFTTMECYLNLANNLESQGFKEEADALYKECMSNFDKKDAEMKQYDQDNDFNGSVNSGENMSQKLMLQQQRLFGGFNQSIKEKDASVIQRIGIYFRQRQEYERACDVLERVLEVRKKQFLQRKQKEDDGKFERLSDFQMPIDEEDLEQFQGREFATLYNDLALTYQCMEDLAYAQEYLVLAIQCLEKLQAEDIDTTRLNDHQISKAEAEKEQGLQELAESYLFLADILRKQANIEQSSQAMLKAIEIEQDLPDRQLCLVESYKQLAEDYLVLQDFEQGVQSAKLALDIELQIYDGGGQNENIQETLLFIAEAHQFSCSYVESNEQLSVILEAFTTGDVDVETQLKTLKLVSVNLQSLENYEEAINYQTKTLKLCEDLEDKINIYQQIANNFLQLGDHAQAIENQLMVYNLVRVIANGGNEENLEECEETEQTIQALYNLAQIKFMVVQTQVNEANEYGDTSVINTEFLLDTKNNLDLLVQRMTEVYGEQQLLGRPEYVQTEQMLGEIDELIS